MIFLRSNSRSPLLSFGIRSRTDIRVQAARVGRRAHLGAEGRIPLLGMHSLMYQRWLNSAVSKKRKSSGQNVSRGPATGIQIQIKRSQSGKVVQRGRRYTICAIAVRSLSSRSLLLSLLLLHLVRIIHFQRLCKLDVVQSSLLVRERPLEESVELDCKENQLIGLNADVKPIPHLQSSCPRNP
jgi:hypothetical protein